MYILRDFKNEDKNKLLPILMEMKKYYPHIIEWSKKILQRIESKKSFCKIATWEERIIGLALMTEKEEGIIKLNTFYISEPYQKKYALGQDLLQEVLRESLKRYSRYIYVTLGADLFDKLVPFFEGYGFQIDGIAPNRYRKEKFEIIMGKTHYYEEIPEGEFYEFIKQQLFINRGYEIQEEGDGDFLISPCYDALGFRNLRNLNKTIVRISTESNPTADDIAKFDKKYPQKAINKIFISFYGFEKFYEGNKDILVFDAYDIETIFYPAELVFSPKKQKDFIVPLSSSWVDKNLPPSTAYITPSRFQNRSKKIIPRESDFPKKEFKRGSHLILYDKDRNKMLGTTKLVTFQEGDPKDLFEYYRDQANVSLKELEDFAGLVEHCEEKSVMILEVEWYKEFIKGLCIEELSGIDKERIKDPSNNALYPISHEKFKEIVQKVNNE